MLSDTQIKSLPNLLKWVKDLKVGDKFLVYDNSLCLEVEKDEDGFEYRKRSALHPNCHVSKESNSSLIIENLFMKKWTTCWGSDKEYPTVLLKSSITNCIYEVGICWGKY